MKISFSFVTSIDRRLPFTYYYIALTYYYISNNISLIKLLLFFDRKDHVEHEKQSERNWDKTWQFMKTDYKDVRNALLYIDNTNIFLY